MNPLGAIGSVIGIVDKFIPDPAMKAEAMKAIVEFQTQVDLKQVDANMASPSPWRDAIGWVCAACFAYALIGREVLMVLGNTVFGIDPSVIPPFNDGLLQTVLFGILGLGAMRTYEKTAK